LKIRALSAVSLAAMLSCVSPAMAQDDASDQDNSANISQAAERAEIQAEARLAFAAVDIRLLGVGF
jgi:hypothetical protein